MSSRAQRLPKEPVGAGEPGLADGAARGSKRRGHAVVKALLLGGVVALAAKPAVRNRLLDALFGPEEQFEYDSVTEPVAAPIASAEPRSPVQEPASDAGEAAPPPAEESRYRSWYAPSQDPSVPTAEPASPADDGPAAVADPPVPMYERWARGGDDAPAAASEQPRSLADDDRSAASEDAPAPAYGAWSRVNDEAGAPAEPADTPAPDYEAWSRINDEAGAPAGSADSPAPDYAVWSRIDDAPAPPRDPPASVPWLRDEKATTSAGEPVSAAPDQPAASDEPVSRSDEATSAAGATSADEATSAAGEPPTAAPDASAAVADERAGSDTAQAESEPEQPAIGEANSPRTGWWIPRRRRTEPTPEPPSLD